MGFILKQKAIDIANTFTKWNLWKGGGGGRELIKTSVPMFAIGAGQTQTKLLSVTIPPNKTIVNISTMLVGDDNQWLAQVCLYNGLYWLVVTSKASYTIVGTCNIIFELEDS